MIREATKEDILECARPGIELEKHDPCDFLAVEIDGAKMVAFILADYPVAEIHIMCPRRHVRKSREMCAEVENWLILCGFKVLKLKIGHQYKTAHNLALKLGYSVIGSDDIQKIYEKIA